MSAPKVIPLPEGLELPEGYQEVVINKGTHAGRYAVQPDPKCEFCISGDPGYMIVRLPDSKKSSREKCSCVVSRLAVFLRRVNFMQGAQIGNKTNNGGQRSHRDLQLERIDQVIASKQEYVLQRQRIVQQLEAEGAEAVGRARAEAEETLQVEAQLRARVESLTKQAEKCEEQAAALHEEAKRLLRSAEQAQKDIVSLNADAVRQKISSIEVQYQGAVELALSDGRFRRYQADVERLRERRAKLAGDA